jgi:hypothetical protein
MNFKKVAGLAVTALALNLSILGDVNAASIRVKCEVRDTSRSKVSVDGAGLSGKYFARVYSGGIWKSSRVKAANSSHEVEFDFDSNSNDIKAGATAIPATYIKGGKVVGSIRRAGTNALIGSVGAACRVR